MKVFVCIHEYRVYQATIEAPSVEAGRAQIEEWHRSNELPFDTYRVDVEAVEHPCERAA